MKNLQDIGVTGESQARSYLERKGWRWLASNFRTRWGEIDLVMEEGSTLVFVEVKHRLDASFGEPQEAVTRTKRSHMTKAALEYIQKTGLTDRNVRFDVVAIGPSGLRHYPGAFAAAGNFYY